MKIKGVEGYSPEAIRDEINRGAKLVMFTYCVSILVMTFKRPSGIYFVRAGHSRIVKGLPFSLVSLLFGWWGFPWGPIYSIESLVRNFGGGMDVTDDVMRSLMPDAPPPIPAAQLTGNSRAPRVDKSGMTLRQKLIGGSAVAAIFLSVYAIWCASSAKRTVILLSGLPAAYTVELNGQEITLPPHGLVRLEQPEGEFKLTGSPGNASETFLFETPFWSRPFNEQIAIVNPDKLGVFYQRNVLYFAESARPAGETPIAYTLFANQRVYLIEKPNYVFQEPPRNISLSSGTSSTTHTALAQLTKLAPQETCDLIEKKIGRAAAETYLKNLVALRAEDEEVIKAAIAILKPETALGLFEARLAERPVQMNLHRFYQNLCQAQRPKFDLAAQYAAFAKAEPANGAFLYLQGRIQTDVAQARAFYEQALTAAQPCAYGHLGLGAQDINAASFETALAHLLAAEKGGVISDRSHELKQAALLGLQRYDDLLTDVRALRRADPRNIELAADEIRFTLLKTPDAALVRPLIDTFCRTALEDWNEAEKPKARTYLEAAVAYTLGDEKTFVEKSHAFTGSYFAFEAAVSTGDCKAAAAALGADARADYQLMLYLLAVHTGDTEAAESFWKKSATALQTDYKSEPAVIAFLEGENDAPQPEKICQLHLQPDVKRVLLAALGVRFPQHRAVFHDYAARFNHHPGFPHLLVDSILRQPANAL